MINSLSLIFEFKLQAGKPRLAPGHSFQKWNSVQYGIPCPATNNLFDTKTPIIFVFISVEY